MVFESKDQELIDKFHFFIKSQKKDQLIDELGIDYFSELVIFGVKMENQQVIVFSFLLSNKNIFEKQFSNYFNNKFVHYSTENIGFIAFSTSNKVSNSALKNYLKSLKKSKTNISKSNNDKLLLNFNMNNSTLNNDYFIKKGNIYSTFSENSLEFRGKIYLKNSFVRPRKWTLKQEYELHPFKVENFLLDKPMKDTIQQFLNKSGLYTPPITGFTFNYYGLDIQDHESGLVFTPKFDMILHFDIEIEKSQLYFDSEKLRRMGFSYDGNKLIAGDILYTVEKLDEKTLFIGFNRNIVVIRENYNLLKISGNPAKLTDINGGGFIQSMINIVPEYKASKTLFNSMNRCELRITPKNNHLLFVRGNIEFFEQKYLYNEMLRFYLTINGIY